MRVMFDSNAYDAILKHGDAERIFALMSAEKISVTTTHIQEDEIRKNPEKDKREALLSIFFRLSTNRKNTPSALWDISKWGESSWAGPEESFRLSAIQRNRPTKSEDEVLGTAAEKYCDVFVTEDKKFAARLTSAAPHIRVLTYSAFRAEFLS